MEKKISRLSQFGGVQNPYNFEETPSGSSSGSAISVAASLVAVALGTETDGSILSPCSYNSVVGIKPTVGLTSRAGVVPISPRQDTVGYVALILDTFNSQMTSFFSLFFGVGLSRPICRTVSDAAYVLDVIAGADNIDIATIETSKYIPEGGYAQFLKCDGLGGKRLGILRAFYDLEDDPFLTQIFEKHLNTLR